MVGNMSTREKKSNFTGFAVSLDIKFQKKTMEIKIQFGLNIITILTK